MKRYSKFPITLFLLFFLSTPFLFASTEEGIKKNVVGFNYYLDNPHYGILIVTTTEIEDVNWTNGNPPKGKFTIEEVLRGQFEKPIINLVWRPPKGELYDKKWKEEGEPKQLVWRYRPLPGPKKGEKLIVIIEKTKKVDIQKLWVEVDAYRSTNEVVDVYKFTKENRQSILDVMGPEERSGKIQWPVLLLLFLLVSLCSLVFLGGSFLKSLNLKEKKNVGFLLSSYLY